MLGAGGEANKQKHYYSWLGASVFARFAFGSAPLRKALFLLSGGGKAVGKFPQRERNKLYAVLKG